MMQEPAGLASPWDAVFASIAAGTYATDYSIGDTIQLNLGNYGVVDMQIVGFDVDELSSGGDYASISWASKNLPNVTHRMHSSTSAHNGWASCEMRTWLSSTFFNAIPSDVRSHIVEVKKYSRCYDSSSTLISNNETSDKVWLLSDREIALGSYQESKGPSYSSIYTGNAARIKKRAGTETNKRWWTRSQASAFVFMCIKTDGTRNTGIGATTIQEFAFGFCT
jgi:hypothetical protein